MVDWFYVGKMILGTGTLRVAKLQYFLAHSHVETCCYT
jgi:hypothetical protein